MKLTRIPFNPNTPTKGLFIFLSYQHFNNTGYFNIVQIETGKKIYRKEFSNYITNVHIIGVIAGIAALYWSKENSYKEKIYLINSTSLSWIKNQRVNSPILESKDEVQIFRWFKYLKIEDHLDQFEFWDSTWNRPKNPFTIKHYPCF